MWKCAICLVVLTVTLRALMMHIRIEHANSPNFKIFCGIDGCPKLYTKYDSFYRHVKRRHSDLYETSVFNLTNKGEVRQCCRNGNQHLPELQEQQEQEQQELHCMIEEEDVDMVIPETDVQDIHMQEDQHFQEGQDDCRMMEEQEQLEQEDILITPEATEQMAAKFLLGIKERRNLTQAAVDDIRDGCKNIVDTMKDSFQQNIKERIEADPEIVQQEIVFEHINDAHRCLRDPFRQLNSVYKQEKYLLQNMNYIPPVEIIIGERADLVIRGNRRVVSVKNDVFYYIPIKKSINQFLQNKLILNLIREERMETPHGFYIDVFNGTSLKYHPILNQVENGDVCLFLDIYYDDVEVCNPLGSRSHNMALFYYRICNLDVLYRSKVEAIRLWGIVETAILKKVGMNVILKVLVQDLNSMAHDGWDLTTTDGENIHLRAILAHVLGDTPACNTLLGFKESVGAAFDKCRLCQCIEPDMSYMFDENNFTQLTHANYRQKCRIIREGITKEQRDRFSTIYGINRETLLVQCPYFNIVDNTPYDIMHLLMEGIVPYEIKEILFRCILEEPQFNIQNLTNEIEHYFSFFRYDTMSRPSPITLAILHSGDNKLKQSSEQMHVLLRALPFILVQLIPLDSIEFQFVKQLLEITNILFSAVITLGTNEILKDMISDHLQKFKDLFPKATIIPKQHFLIHFPTIIKKNGPPCRHSASRFESKNKGPKRKMQVRQNFKNPALSIAKAVQRQECMANELEHELQHPIFNNELEIGKTYMYENLNYVKDKLRRFCGIDPDSVEYAHTAKSVTIVGEKFIIDYSFAALASKDFVIEFGLLKNIFLVNSNELFFELMVYDTLNFDDNFQSYVVEVDEPNMAGANIFIKPAELLDFHSYYAYKYEDKLYLQVPYDMFGVVELGEENQHKLHNHLYRL